MFDKIKTINYLDYKLAGFFFILLQVFVILGNSIDYNVYFWYCNHISLFFAVAFFMKNNDMIKGLINVGFILQFLWAIDFIIALFFDVYIFNVTRYVFEDLSGIATLVPIFIHLLTTNVALYLTYDKKPTRKALIYSLIYMIFLYGITLLFALPSRNINCVYEICGLTSLTFPGYTLLWLAIVFLVIVLPTQGIQYLLYKYKSKKK